MLQCSSYKSSSSQAASLLAGGELSVVPKSQLEADLEQEEVLDLQPDEEVNIKQEEEEDFQDVEAVMAVSVQFCFIFVLPILSTRQQDA